MPGVRGWWTGESDPIVVWNLGLHSQVSAALAGVWGIVMDQHRRKIQSESQDKVFCWSLILGVRDSPQVEVNPSSIFRGHTLRAQDTHRDGMGGGLWFPMAKPIYLAPRWHQVTMFIFGAMTWESEDLDPNADSASSCCLPLNKPLAFSNLQLSCLYKKGVKKMMLSGF